MAAALIKGFIARYKPTLLRSMTTRIRLRGDNRMHKSLGRSGNTSRRRAGRWQDRWQSQGHEPGKKTGGFCHISTLSAQSSLGPCADEFLDVKSCSVAFKPHPSRRLASAWLCARKSLPTAGND